MNTTRASSALVHLLIAENNDVYLQSGQMVQQVEGVERLDRCLSSAHRHIELGSDLIEKLTKR